MEPFDRHVRPTRHSPLAPGTRHAHPAPVPAREHSRRLGPVPPHADLPILARPCPSPRSALLRRRHAVQHLRSPRPLPQRRSTPSSAAVHKSFPPARILPASQRRQVLTLRQALCAFKRQADTSSLDQPRCKPPEQLLEPQPRAAARCHRQRRHPAAAGALIRDSLGGDLFSQPLG